MNTGPRSWWSTSTPCCASEMPEPKDPFLVEQISATKPFVRTESPDGKRRTPELTLKDPFDAPTDDILYAVHVRGFRDGASGRERAPGYLKPSVMGAYEEGRAAGQDALARYKREIQPLIHPQVLSRMRKDGLL